MTWGFLFLNAWVGTNLSDVLWARSVVMTSPLVATIGLSLTIPVAMASDLVVSSLLPPGTVPPSQGHFSAAYGLGSGLVMAGFVLGNVGERLQGCCCAGTDSRPRGLRASLPSELEDRTCETTVQRITY